MISARWLISAALSFRLYAAGTGGAKDAVLHLHRRLGVVVKFTPPCSLCTTLHAWSLGVRTDRFLNSALFLGGLARLQAYSGTEQTAEGVP
jgi:cytochrome b